MAKVGGRIAGGERAVAGRAGACCLATRRKRGSASYAVGIGRDWERSKKLIAGTDWNVSTRPPSSAHRGRGISCAMPSHQWMSCLLRFRD